MAFIYATPPTQAARTGTYESKVLLCKSFKIDIAAGSPFLSGTSYPLGLLPSGAQLIGANMWTIPAVSGGTVSAATIQFQVGGISLINGVNVFAANFNTAVSPTYYANLFVTNNDQAITYTPTLTGAGATAGVIHLNIWYVV